MTFIEIYQRFLKGNKFKSASEIDLSNHSVKDPRDLVANSPWLEEIIVDYYSRKYKGKKCKVISMANAVKKR